jgi:hypothetical protein
MNMHGPSLLRLITPKEASDDGYFGLMFLALGMSLVAWRLRQSSARLCQYVIMASSLLILVAFGIGSL